MKINEIFESIQGEGRKIGEPVLFIRTSGCTRDCKWCDTKYHTFFREMSVKQIVNEINKSKMKSVVWTGGEPLLQFEEIKKVINLTNKKNHYLETNGDLLNLKNATYFDYISCSPKCLKTCLKMNDLKKNKVVNKKMDLKIVTNLNLNRKMLKYATSLMPFTTNNKGKDLQIKKKVWHFCLKHNLNYSPRIHVDVFGYKKRGV